MLVQEKLTELYFFVSQVRMDQYFDRLYKQVHNFDMPVRIRFMIQDVMDMRRNKWQPRRIGKGPEGPRTIQQVREDAARDGCIYMPQDTNPSNLAKVPNPMTLINPLEGNFFEVKKDGKGGQGQRRSKDPMEDIFGVSGGYSPYLGTGPGTINGPFELDNESATNSSRADQNSKDHRRGSSGKKTPKGFPNKYDRTFEFAF